MNIKEALNRVVSQLDLSTAEMQDVMREIMTGQCTDAQIGAFLMGMRMKSETIDEIVGAVSVMRELASHVHLQTSTMWLMWWARVATARISSTCRPPPVLSWPPPAARWPSTVIARSPARAAVPICSSRPVFTCS